MTRRPIAALSLLFVAGALVTTGGIGQTSATQSDADASQVRAVKKVHEDFYAALNAMLRGDPAPFADVWWHTDDVVYMGADGAYNVGWDQTYANWKKQAALKIGGQVKPSDVHYTVGPEIAMANQHVTGTNTFNGQAREVNLRATSVFRQQDGVWKMICHHVDVIPPLGQSLDEDE